MAWIDVGTDEPRWEPDAPQTSSGPLFGWLRSPSDYGQYLGHVPGANTEYQALYDYFQANPSEGTYDPNSEWRRKLAQAADWVNRLNIAEPNKGGSFLSDLGKGAVGMAKTLATNPAVLGAVGGYLAAPSAGAGGAAGAAGAGGSSLFPAVAPVAGAPAVGAGGALGATSLGTGLATVAPEFAAWSAGAGGLGAAAGGSSLLGIGDSPLAAPAGGGYPMPPPSGAIPTYAGMTAPASTISQTIKDWLPAVSAGVGLFNSIGAMGDRRDSEAALRAAFDRSDPFAAARQSAGAQYLEWQQDPSKYMSSPIARLQIDEMNREAQRKNAALGQTWNIDEMGNIRGSGTGATEFARQLQFNLARQYEQALGNRAQQAGMSLFPSAEMARSLAQVQGSGYGLRTDAAKNVVGLIGGLGDLYGKYFGA